MSEAEVVVVVEIPRGGRVKFEIDPVTATVWLDRVLSTSTCYPAEYGYVRGTMGGDGDPLDAVVLSEERTVPGCHVRARPIGVLDMSDEHGIDPKLLCVATGDPSMATLTDIGDVAPHVLDEIEHFFRVYKQLEPEAHVETSGWRDAAAARALVAECRKPPPTFRPKEQAMNIQLEAAQVELLREILDGTFRDLRYEVADTDNSRFKDELREREAEVGALLDLVGGPLPDRDD